jgi:hypothetical protein
MERSQPAKAGFVAEYDDTGRFASGYDVAGNPLTSGDATMVQQPADVTPGSGVPSLSPHGPAAGQRQSYGHGKRTFYGLLWLAWTVLLATAGFVSLAAGQVLGGLLALVLAGLAGRYDYRIWTWRARRLVFLIIW